MTTEAQIDPRGRADNTDSPPGYPSGIKQKVLASDLDEWDELIIRSYATRNGERSLYQEGSLAKWLMARYRV